MESGVGIRVAIEEQMASADFGDDRLTKRCVSIMKRLKDNPSASFPQAMVTSAELEGYYRFITNDRVNAERIVEPHSDEVAKQAASVSRPIVIHDSTEVGLSRTPKTANDLCRLRKGHYGTGLHVSLVATINQQERDVLGVSRMEFFDPNHTPEAPTREQRYRHPDNIKWRWLNGVLESEEHLVEAGAKPVHVADRDADSFERLVAFCNHQVDFVIRSNFDRRLDWEEEGRPDRLSKVLQEQPVQTTRTIELSKRCYPLGGPPKRRKRHPERDARRADVEIRSCRVPIARTKTAGLQTDAKRVWVNAVWVHEPSPPDTQEPIDWMLVTSLPIGSAEDVLAIVDIYRARWVVEEFFKCLKTGAALEKRQMESLQTLHNAAALLAPVAARLLHLRYKSRQSPEVPARDLLPNALLRAVEIQCKIDGVQFDTKPKVADVYRLIAKLGGHIKQNGPPGWQVLWRGMKKVRATQSVLEATDNQQVAEM